jgi:hypothetical protein
MSEFMENLKGKFQRRFILLGAFAVVGVIKGMFGAADANAEKSAIETWQKSVLQVVSTQINENRNQFDKNRDGVLQFEGEMGALVYSIPQDCSPSKKYFISDMLFVRPVPKIASLDCTVKVFTIGRGDAGSVTTFRVETKNSKGELQSAVGQVK